MPQKIVHQIAAIAMVLVGSCGFVRAQSIYGQNGTLLNPVAETYSHGNFIVSSYYRNSHYGGLSYEQVPLVLVTGIGTRLEAGFSFPALNGGRLSPDFSDDYTTLGLKLVVKGKPGDPWRMALAGLLQRRLEWPGDNKKRSQSTAGIQVISSHYYELFNLHLNAGSLLGKSNSYLLFSGLGLVIPLTSRMDYFSDLRAERDAQLGFSAQALAGIKLGFLPNLGMRIGGGIGLAEDDYDWQVFFGLHLSTDFKEGPRKRNTDLIAPPSLEFFDTAMPGRAEPPQTTGQGMGGKGEGQGWDDERELSHRLFYDFSSLQLSAFEMPALEDLISEINSLDPRMKIQVVGHTDRVGGSGENLQWGLARSLNLVKLLFQQSTISPEQLLITSGGETALTDTRTTASADQMNRRVSLHTWTGLEAQRQQALDSEQSWDLQRRAAQSGDTLIFATGRVSSRERLRLVEIIGQAQIAPDDRILIEALWSQKQDPMSVYRRLASVWEALTESQQMAPKQVYLRILESQRSFDSLPASRGKVSLAFDQPKSHGDQWSISLRIGRQNSEVLPTGFKLAMVADLGQTRYCSNGEILSSRELPDPGGLPPMDLPLTNRKIQQSINFPMEYHELAHFSLLVFDSSGKLRQRIPVYDDQAESKLDLKVIDALRIPDAGEIVKVPIMITLLKANSQ